MYLPISDVKLTQINSGAKGSIFVGTERYGSHRPSSYVVVDGGRLVQSKLALGLSGNGAFTANRLGPGELLYGLELPHAELVELELGDTKTTPFNGTLKPGQLLVTTGSAYLGITWFHTDMPEFALVNLQTWTLESYVSLMNSDVNTALLVDWELVHRHQDQTMVLATPAAALTR